MSEPANFIQLKLNIEKCLVFDDQWWENRQWEDPLTKRAKSGKVYVLHVVLEDNHPVDKQYSVMSRRHVEDLDQMKETGMLLNRPLCITKLGEGYRTKYSIRIGPG